MKKIILLFLIVSTTGLGIAQVFDSKHGNATVNYENQRVDPFQMNHDSILPFKENLQTNQHPKLAQKIVQGSIFKSVTITAGNLSSALTTVELNTITNLTITGTIDTRDFKTMRDNMPNLTYLYIDGADISAYTGTDGTYSTANIAYPVNEIPADAFYNYGTKLGKASLISISLPLSITSIGNYAFQNGGLSSIYITSNVKSIGNYAFYSCSNLTTVTIPSSVISIGSYAFSNCTGLTSIYALATTPVNLSLSTNVFSNVNKTTCTLFVPSISMSLYAASVQWKDFITIMDKDLIFLLATKSLNLAAGSSTTPVDLTINTSWSASSDQSWLTVSPGSGTGNATLTITAEANQTIMTRNATVTILTSGGVSRAITIIQTGQPKIINIAAGGLYSALTMNERKTISNLVVSGTIDARDFRILRDSMPLLSDLNIGDATILAYTGTEGTYNTGNIAYPANEIPTDAFYNNNTYSGKTSLISITMPISTTSIGNYAFENCNGLSGSLNIPSSVINIGNYALSYCTRVTEITIPDGVTFIGSYAFSGCSGITGITIPNSVSSIGTAIFQSCINLTGITVQSGNLDYSSLDGVLFNKDQSILVETPGGKNGSYSIPTSVSSIAGYAFYLCNKLTSITIPTSVKSISNYAFYYCIGLKSISIPSSVLSLGSNAFGMCTGLTSISTSAKPLDLSTSANVFYSINKSTCTLNVPYNSKSLYQSANQWKDFVNIVEDSQGFLVGTNKVNFDATTSTNNVTIDANTDWNAMSDKTWLSVSPGSGNGNNTLILSVQANQTNATRTATVTVSATGEVSQVITVTQTGLPKTTFVTAGNLASLLTPDELNGVIELSLTGTVDARDFKTMRDNMPVLSKLDLSGVTVTAYSGTEGTAGRTITVYPDNTIPDYAFSLPITYLGKTSLKTLLLPNNITSIGNTAFENCTGITGSLSIPTTVTSIGNYAFYNCTGFTGTLSIPAMVNYIGDNAFMGCSGFTGALTIPSSVTSIGVSCFGICSRLTSVSIPASVLKIGDYAFRRCIGSITVDSNNPNYAAIDGVLFDKNQTVLIHFPLSRSGSYAIPSTVITIASGAFDNCTINSVTTPSSVITIGGSAFYDCYNLNALTMGNSVTTIETNAFYYCIGLTSLSLPASVKSIGTYAFYYCNGLSSLSLPASVKSIGSYAFYNCSGLTSLYTYSPVPVDLSLSNSVFYGIDKTICTLNVPTGSKTAYLAAYQWKDFTLMSEFVASAVPVLLDESIHIYPNPVSEVMKINGIKGVATLKLSDINGRLMYMRQITNNEPVPLNSLPRGFYVLKLSTTEGTVERKIIKR